MYDKYWGQDVPLDELLEPQSWRTPYWNYSVDSSQLELFDEMVEELNRGEERANLRKGKK